MSPLNIALDGGGTPMWQSLVTALSPAVVAALAALGGVYLSNLSAARHRAEDRRQRREDRLFDDETREAQVRRDRGLAALALAEHLEDFVIDCLKVVRSFWGAVWTSPYSWDADAGAEPRGLRVLPELPPLVDWRLLGLETAVRATNFRRKIELRREQLSGASQHADGDEHHADEADSAAALALEAWALAAEVRRANGLDAFEWPAEWSGTDEFQVHQDKRARIRAQQEAGGFDLD